jgi:uncharacterized membrane protein
MSRIRPVISPPTRNVGHVLGISLWAVLLTVAVALVVLGIVRIARRDFVWGGLLIAAGLLIGPGGFNIFR